MPTLLITSRSWDKSLMRQYSNEQYLLPSGLRSCEIRDHLIFQMSSCPQHTSPTATHRAPCKKTSECVVDGSGIEWKPRCCLYAHLSLDGKFSGPPPAEKGELWQRPAQLPILLKLSFNFLIPRLSGIPWQSENHAFHSSLPNLSFRWFLPSWLTI